MAAIDFEIDRLFGNIASIRMDIIDYESWCKTYEGFNYPEWTIRDGSKIKLSDMSLKHLHNTINLVYKKDRNNSWLKILKQEKKYRELKDKIQQLKKNYLNLRNLLN